MKLYFGDEDIRRGIRENGNYVGTLEKAHGQAEKRKYYQTADIGTFRRAVRGHWSVESMHWHLDVTFREDVNTTLDKQAAQNQDIIRKWSLGILKMIEILKSGLSLRKKRYAISLLSIEYLEEVLSL